MKLKDFERAKEIVGGAFLLSVLLQKRVIELVRGAPPLVEFAHKDPSPIDVALQEVLEEKVSLEMIPQEEFERLVEEARLEREARATRREEEFAFGPRPAMPTIDLAPDAAKSSTSK